MVSQQKLMSHSLELKVQGWISLRLLPLACRWPPSGGPLLAVFSPGLLSVHIAGICLFYEDSHFGSESHFMTSWVAQC